MNCQKFKTEFEERGRGARLTGRAESHAAHCDSCRAFRAEGDALRALVGGLARVEAPGDFDFRLRARIARSEGARFQHAGWRGFVPGAAWLTAAGCLVLALGVFVRFRPGQTAPPPTPRAVAQTQEAVPDAATAGEQARANADDTQQQPVSVQEVSERETLAAAAVVRRGSRAARAPQGQKFILPREAAREIAGLQNTEGATETHMLDSRGMKIYVGSPIALPVSTQESRLEALFKDTSGATRSVSVDAVTFGARGLPARRAQVRNASYAQGVW
jgi:hypothetical protein